MNYIYHVSFHELPQECYGEKCDFFYTSLAAIYDEFSPEDIGCKVGRLWNLKITPDNPYVGRKCTISKEPITRKTQIKIKKFANFANIEKWCYICTCKDKRYGD